MPLDARDCSYEEIVLRPLRIARYQRHYEWSTLQMEQLIADLVGVYKQKGIDSRNDYYFLGTFIVHQRKKGSELVDGQQRLVSLMIILATCRDLLLTQEQKAATDRYITIPRNPLDETSAQQRLTLHRGDNDFFLKNIVEPGATTRLPDQQANQSHESMRLNVLRAHQWLNTELAADELPGFVNFIANDCRIVRIALQDEEDVFRIFETVNARGLPLKEEDILRFKLIEFATEDESERARLMRIWDEVERSIGQGWMPKFLEQLRRIHTKDVYQRRRPLRDVMLGSLGTREQAHKFLSDVLKEETTLYNYVCKTKSVQGLGRSSAGRKISLRLRSLHLVNFDDWIPVARLMIERFWSAPDAMLKHLGLLDRLAWLFYLMHDAKKIDEDRYLRFGRVINALKQDGAFELRTSYLDLSDNEKAYMRSEISEIIPEKKPWLKHLLVRLEYEMHPNRNVASLRSYTIEHVLPLNPDENDAYWWTRYDNKKAVVAEYARYIGNICLVTDEINALLGNRPYPEKREIMKEEECGKDSLLAAEVITVEDWNRNAIETRNRRLLKLFCDTFDVHAR